MRHICALTAAVMVATVLADCGGATKAANLATTPATSPAKSEIASTYTPSPEAKAITEYGHEASHADQKAITALVNRYYDDGAADDGAGACGLIYSPLSESVAEDYGQSPGPAYLSGKTCAVVMSKLFLHPPSQPPSDLATTQVTGVRVMGRKGYALLRSKAIPAGYIAVERELGAWKVGTIIGGPLPGTQAPSTQAGSKANNFSDYEAPGLPKVKDADDGDDDPASNDDEVVVDYGKAASPADQKAIANLIRGYYAATSADRGSAICSRIYNVVSETIPENYESSTGLKGATCATTMTKVFASHRRQAARDLSELKLTRVRVEGAKGRAMVYVGKHPEPYFEVHRQGSEWKMQTLFAVGLP